MLLIRFFHDEVGWFYAELSLIFKGDRKPIVCIFVGLIFFCVGVGVDAVIGGVVDIGVGIDLGGSLLFSSRLFCFLASHMAPFCPCLRFVFVGFFCRYTLQYVGIRIMYGA